MKKKQFLLRNMIGNKHFTNVLSLLKNNTLEIESTAIKTLEELRKDERIQYCIFSVERGRRQNLSSFHFQGYIEFSRPIDALAFKREGEFSDVQSRSGTQEQAINYVKKERTKILNKFFEFGIPKKQGRVLKLYNHNDLDIRKDLDYQRILLDLRLQENYYSKFEDLKNDFHLLFIKHDKGCKNLGDKHNPVKKLDVLPARTIGIYGHSNVGKTTGTNNYLKENGYTDLVITKKKASSETRPKLGFDLKDENTSVLGIEEIRQNFPDGNDIIQLIDKGSRLEVKGSQIDNNFELIIFNSLYSPEQIYSNLKYFGHKVEILRRLYKGRESKVYELIPDKENYNKLIDRTNELPEVLNIHLRIQETRAEEKE